MSGERILIIDDSKEIVNHLTKHLLPTFGYTSLHALDGQTGLQLIREKKPDLVMLDFNLPEMTGIEVLQQMAQESINTPVVLMTGYGSELSAIEAFRLGAKDYIIKPFTVDEIVETIDRALVETRLHHDKEELAEQVRRVKVEMTRQSNEMKTLSNIGKAITSLLSVDKILERVLEAATELTDAEECTIWLADEENKVLKAYGSNQNGDETELTTVPIEGSQMGEVMQTGQPFRHSEFSDKGIQIRDDYYVRAVIFVPLKLRGVTLGVLGVNNIEAFRSFSKRDEFLLGFLADYAAIAFENARVFQAADQALTAGLEELNTLIEITRTITSSVDLDEVVQLTIQQVHDSWHIEASSVWWLNDNRQTLRVLSNVGTPSEVLTTMEVPLGEGIVGHVAQTGKWVYTNDVLTHPYHYRQVDQKTGFQTRSLLCVPLVFRDEVVGVMQLLNKLDGDFDDRDVERALSIASAIAIAVTNALLFEESESREAKLKPADYKGNFAAKPVETSNNSLILPKFDEMQSPLARMKLLIAQFDQAEGSLSEEQQAVFEEIRLTSTYVMDMMNDLSVIAQLNQHTEQLDEACDLLEIVSEVVNEYQEKALSKRVALVLTAVPDISFVQGNPQQISHALGNLVDNAIKFSPEDEKIEIIIQEKDDCVLIQVQDHGEGIAEEDIPHIFDEFYQGKDGASEAAGPGLGLALVHSVAKAHGGDVWVESQNGLGSNFIFKLPVPAHT